MTQTTDALLKARLLSLLRQIDTTLPALQAEIDRYRSADSLADARSAIKRGLIPHWTNQPSSEQWQTRPRGQSKYLYLTWTYDCRGKYRGPGDKRKVYIGATKTNIELARQLTANLEHLQQLRTLHRDLSNAPRYTRDDLQRIEHLLESTLAKAEELCSSTTPS